MQARYKKCFIIKIFTGATCKTNFLTARGNFSDIVDIVARKLCCLRVYLGNFGDNLWQVKEE